MIFKEFHFFSLFPALHVCFIAIYSTHLLITLACSKTSLLAAPVSEHKKVTDYVSGLFRLDIRPPRPSSRLANQSPAPGSCDQTSTNQEAALELANHTSPPPSPSRVNGIPASSNEASRWVLKLMLRQ